MQSAGSGILLLKPAPDPIDGDRDIACEMHLAPHSPRAEYCILKLSIVSESKHIELYLDDSYEETCKGCMVTVKKGK